jgi:hypothetical protein
VKGSKERTRRDVRLLWNRAKGFGALLSFVLLTGCLHQEQAPPLAPQAKTPNIYVPPPTDAQLPPMKSGDTPPTLTDAKPVPAAEEVKPKKRTKRQQTISPVTATPPPATATAEAPANPPATLGAIAPGGGNANPKQQQEVMAKIGAVEKRVNDLPGATADREQKQIAKVRQFLKEASDALKGGDVDGAGILATKADLLMDDLTK